MLTPAKAGPRSRSRLPALWITRPCGQRSRAARPPSNPAILELWLAQMPTKPAKGQPQLQDRGGRVRSGVEVRVAGQTGEGPERRSVAAQLELLLRSVPLGIGLEVRH